MVGKTKYWEEHGKTLYHMGDNPVRSYLIEMINSLKVKSLLDVGCGSGPMYEIMRDKNLLPERYVGTEYSGAFVEVCQRVFPEAIWIEDDMRDFINFVDDEFDMLLYLHSFCQTNKWMDTLDEAYRVTKKYVLICMWRPFTDDGKTKTSHHAQHDDSYLTEYGEKELEDYIKNIGFKIITADEMMNGKQYNFIYLLSKEKDDKKE